MVQQPNLMQPQQQSNTSGQQFNQLLDTAAYGHAGGINPAAMPMQMQYMPFQQQAWSNQNS
jgi:hypothetical protein